MFASWHELLSIRAFFKRSFRLGALATEMEQLWTIFRIPTFRALLLLGEARAVTDALFDFGSFVAPVRKI